MGKQWSKWGRYFLLPSIFTGLIVLIHLLSWAFNLDIVQLGLYPGKISGLIGIFTMPLIHGGWEHLLNNSTSILFLLLGLRFFYQPLFFRVFLISYLFPGLLAWFFARPAFHVGASGMIYALAGFLFFSGVIRLNRYLLAFSMAIVFWYGGLFWGMFPMEKEISWEGHLSGGLVGFVTALWYRRVQPAEIFQEPDPFEDEDPEMEDPLIGDAWKVENQTRTEQMNYTPPNGYRVVYRIRPKNTSDDKKKSDDPGPHGPGRETPSSPSSQ